MIFAPERSLRPLALSHSKPHARWDAERRRAWNDAIAGTSALVFLCGPPGSGKSRLASEAVTVAEDVGGVAFWAHVMGFVERVCSRVVILKAGRVVAEDAPARPLRSRAPSR